VILTYMSVESHAGLRFKHMISSPRLPR
jgi:hypothetical protein